MFLGRFHRFDFYYFQGRALRDPAGRVSVCHELNLWAALGRLALHPYKVAAEVWAIASDLQATQSANELQFVMQECRFFRR